MIQKRGVGRKIEENRRTINMEEEGGAKRTG